MEGSWGWWTDKAFLGSLEHASSQHHAHTQLCPDLLGTRVAGEAQTLRGLGQAAGWGRLFNASQVLVSRPRGEGGPRREGTPDSPLVVRLPKGKAGEGLVLPGVPAEGVLSGLVGEPWAGRSRLAPRPKKGGPEPQPAASGLPGPCPSAPPQPSRSPGGSLSPPLSPWGRGSQPDYRPPWAPSLHPGLTVCWWVLWFPRPRILRASQLPHSPIQKFLVSKSLSVTSLVVSRRPR